MKYLSTAETAWAIYFPEVFARAGGKLWLAWDFFATLQWWGDPALLCHHHSEAPHRAEVSWECESNCEPAGIWETCTGDNPGSRFVIMQYSSRTSREVQAPLWCTCPSQPRHQHLLCRRASSFRPPFAKSKLLLQCSYGALLTSPCLGHVLHSAGTWVTAAFRSILAQRPGLLDRTASKPREEAPCSYCRRREDCSQNTAYQCSFVHVMETARKSQLRLTSSFNSFRNNFPSVMQIRIITLHDSFSPQKYTAAINLLCSYLPEPAISSQGPLLKIAFGNLPNTKRASHTEKGDPADIHHLWGCGEATLCYTRLKPLQ